VLNLLGNTTEPVRTGDPDVRSLDRQLLLVIAQRTVWRRALDEAKRRAGLGPPSARQPAPSALGRRTA